MGRKRQQSKNSNSKNNVGTERQLLKEVQTRQRTKRYQTRPGKTRIYLLHFFHYEPTMCESGYTFLVENLNIFVFFQGYKNFQKRRVEENMQST